jgi:hypothetical protein
MVQLSILKTQYIHAWSYVFLLSIEYWQCMFVSSIHHACWVLNTCIVNTQDIHEWWIHKNHYIYGWSIFNTYMQGATQYMVVKSIRFTFSTHALDLSRGALGLGLGLDYRRGVRCLQIASSPKNQNTRKSSLFHFNFTRLMAHLCGRSAEIAHCDALQKLPDNVHWAASRWCGDQAPQRTAAVASWKGVFISTHAIRENI